MSILPSDFKLPNGNLISAWQHWCCRDTARNLPALKMIKSNDIADLKIRKRFSDLKYAMTLIQDYLTENGAWIENPTSLQANEMLAIAQEHIGVSVTTPQTRNRRIAQMKWTTVVKEMRKARR